MINQAVSTAPRRVSVPTGRRHRLSSHYEHILSQLQCLGSTNANGRPTHGIGVVGLGHGDGASTVSANLAIAASRLGMDSVVLVDANRLQPTLHKTFGIAAAPGLSEAMCGERDLMDCIHMSHFPGLSVLPWGAASDRAAMMVEPKALAERFGALSKSFGLTLVDLPSAGETGLGLSLAKTLSGVVLVLEAESSRRSAALRTKQQLEHAGVNILGVVLNKHRRHLPNWLYRAI